MSEVATVTFLSEDEVARINDVRLLMYDMESRAMAIADECPGYEAFGAGRVSETCLQAQDAIFAALSAVAVYLKDQAAQEGLTIDWTRGGRE